MARNKVLKVPKPPKQYNNRGYEYPLSEGYMEELDRVISRCVTQEANSANIIPVINNEEFLRYFVRPEDYELCMNLSERFFASPSRVFSFPLYLDDDLNAIEVRVRYVTGTIVPVAVPQYAATGPRNTVEASAFREHLVACFLKQHQIFHAWREVYCYISTLNSLCTSLADMLANFPALELLMKETNRIPPERKTPFTLTKLPVELRQRYNDCTRTVTRRALLTPVDVSVHDRWVLDTNHTYQRPEWLLRSPGFSV